MLRLVLLAGLLALAKAEDVVVGTKDNFPNLVKDTKYVLAEFYAPWCGHCKNLEPEYTKAATTLKAMVPDVKLVKVDATVERDLGEKYGVQGFPTLKWFREGAVSDYGGGRDHDAIVNWVKKKAGPPSKTLGDQASVDAFGKEGDAVLLGLFQEGDADLAKFESAAGTLDSMPAGHTSNADVIAKYAPAKIVMLQNFDDQTASFDGEINAEAISKFAHLNSMPMVIAFTSKTQGKIFADTAPKRHVLALHSEGYTEKANLEGELKALAKEHRGKFLFITVEKTSDNEGVFNFFGVVDATQPKIVSINQEGGGMKKWFYDGEAKADAMKEWLADILSGKVKLHLKSEEPPAQKNGPVKVLVGKTFKQDVVDSGKDVLVEFYAPWCGHCKSLEPEYNKLGEEFKGVDSVVIAKMDSTANEIMDVDVQGFPTLYFFKSTGGKPIKHDGARTQKDLSAFVRANVGTPIKSADDKKEL